jgi:hypothetical protein
VYVGAELALAIDKKARMQAGLAPVLDKKARMGKCANVV